MGRENRYIGIIGERIALKFLKRRGYKILETNLRTVFGEIDAIAKQKDFTVFIEIKTRTTFSFGPPYLSVTKAKQMHIVKSALSYLKRYRLINSNWRVDVVSVKLNHKFELENIEIIENAIEDYKGGWS